LSNSIVTLIQAVTAARQSEAKQRVPVQYKGKITFFSKLDLWRYLAVLDDRLCPLCVPHHNMVYRGDELLALFPYLEVLNAVALHPHVHPNCRCYMIRTEKI
jgi:hypothetical protein